MGSVAAVIAALTALLPLIPQLAAEITALINLLKNPNPTQADCDAAVALMDKAVASWDNRSKN